MRIYYPKRSNFLKDCERIIRQNKDELLSGIPVTIRLSPQGYNGKIRVSIEEANFTTFWADWEYSDPTRFPARIRAAAYALFRQGCFGEFIISHKTGILTIQYVASPTDASDDVEIEKPTSLKIQKSDVSSIDSVHKPMLRKHHLEKDVERCIVVAEILYSKFNQSDEGIFGYKDMPEEVLPESVKKGSYEHLMFITLTVSIDYQRDATELWRASRQTINDASTRWIYYPEEVIKRSEKELINAMQKYNLAKKPVKDPLEIWRPVCKSFYELFDSDPRNLLKECGYDALKVFNLLKSKYKPNFPYLSGKKILPLWIRMLHDVVGIDLKNLDKIPIPVDIHIARATFCIGGLRGKYEGNIQNVFHIIDEVWEEACKSLPYYRLQLDEPLWHLSKHGCTNRIDNYCIKARECPVSRYCVSGKIYVSANKIVIET
ncbi:hypothetical protein DRO97_11300 [Archaeoglobales archaeon]|nr:MAG: hypothetical protein DRO97_11300 [Archaeoglobales archaeon]